MAEKILSIEDLTTVARTGVVVKVREWSETHVNGGSAQQTSNIGPQGGTVTSPEVRISSTVSDRLHVFVRQDDGREFDQTFVNPGVGLREGHRISIVYVPDEDGEPLALINHHTGKSRIYEGRVSPLLGARPAPLISSIMKVYMMALLPLHIATYWLGFTGKLNHLEGIFGRAGGLIEWILLNGLLIGLIVIIGMLAPGVAPGLKDQVIARIRREIERLLGSNSVVAAGDGLDP